MNRIALLVVAGLTALWIVASYFLLPGGTNNVVHNVAVWVAIPLAVWLCGLALIAYRGRRRSHED